MTTQDQIKAMAKLDGRAERGLVELDTHPIEEVLEPLPDYLNSRDAIVPVIKKCIEKGLCGQHFFINCLNKILTNKDFAKYPLTIFATPAQLSKALLHATGKWKN